MRRLRIGALAIVLASGAGCARLALDTVADTLSAPGKTYARDDDPELVRAAVPVILKVMEQVHEGVPRHRALSEALSRTCTQYGVAFIEEDADRLNETDVAAAKPVYARARRLFLRGFGYALDAWDVALPGARATLQNGSRDARDALLARAQRKDVPLLYWTGAALGSAIASAKDDMKLVGQLPLVEQLMRRALELDEGFDDGAIHEFYITWAASHDERQNGGSARAREHFERAVALSHHQKLSPLVSYAENVDVTAQNKAEFEKLLDEVLAFDVDSAPDYRLANVLAQRRARWLLSRTADLFAE